jgi:dihydrofolate reductase
LRKTWNKWYAIFANAPGKDIWLFGGGSLFHTFLDKGLVDTVEVGLIPALLGGAMALLPAPARRESLILLDLRLYKNSGVVMLTCALK